MGNFHSKAASSAMQSSLPANDADFGSLRAAFDSLAALIEQYPRIRTDCKFVFVPGPGDPAPSATLPQVSLKKNQRVLLGMHTLSSWPAACCLMYHPLLPLGKV
eukprot:32725-Chlamydomonas_euryale.AAC.15